MQDPHIAIVDSNGHFLIGLGNIVGGRRLDGTAIDPSFPGSIETLAELDYGTLSRIVTVDVRALRQKLEAIDTYPGYPALQKRLKADGFDDTIKPAIAIIDNATQRFIPRPALNPDATEQQKTIHRDREFVADELFASVRAALSASKLDTKSYFKQEL